MLAVGREACKTWSVCQWPRLLSRRTHTSEEGTHTISSSSQSAKPPAESTKRRLRGHAAEGTLWMTPSGPPAVVFYQDTKSLQNKQRLHNKLFSF